MYQCSKFDSLVLGAFLLSLIALFIVKRVRLRRAAQNFESARNVSSPLRSRKEYQALGGDEIDK